MAEETHSPIVRFGLGVGVFFCFISAPLSGYFLTDIVLEARASADWPAVDGRLARARVRQSAGGRFSPDVSYIYLVHARTFTGSRVRTSDGEYDSRDGAARAIQGLREGGQVSVYYHPTNPAKSVLRPGAGFQEYALLAIPVVVFAMGVLGFLRLRRTRRGAGFGGMSESEVEALREADGDQDHEWPGRS